MKAQALRDTSMTSYMMSKKIMEINPRHAIIKTMKEKLSAEADSSQIADLVYLLYDTALLASGFSLEDASDFAGRIHRMIKMGLSLEDTPDVLEDDTMAVEQPVLQAVADEKMEEVD